jgi:hypothetical protein
LRAQWQPFLDGQRIGFNPLNFAKRKNNENENESPKKFGDFLYVVCAAVAGRDWPSFGYNLYDGLSATGWSDVQSIRDRPGAANGETFSYTGFNPSQYQQLYWGLNSVANVNEGTPNGNMQFQSYNSTTGIAVWTSTANWIFTSPINLGCCDQPTQLLFSCNPIPERTPVSWAPDL